MPPTPTPEPDPTPPDNAAAAAGGAAPVPPITPAPIPPAPLPEVDDAQADLVEQSFNLLPRLQEAPVGSPAGIEHEQLKAMPSTPGIVEVTCIDYSPERVHVLVVDDLEDFIIHHRPEWSAVRWINVNGLTDMTVIHALAEKYELHPLAIEDLLHLGQRPKVDSYGETGKQRPRLFIIARMIQQIGEDVSHEQISMFLGQKTLLTFQINKGDVWDPIRQRIQHPASRLRQNDAGFLAYCLLDAVVDQCFPILEQYGDQLEELEEQVMRHPDEEVIHQIHRIKRELLLIRRDLWPMRELIHQLQSGAHVCLSSTTQTYLSDVYDHVVQIIDLLETYREVALGLAETYRSTINLRMNEIMKVLTIFATMFMPLSFLASVYGMNFEFLPELKLKWGYPVFWLISIALGVSMFLWFRKRKWI